MVSYFSGIKGSLRPLSFDTGRGDNLGSNYVVALDDSPYAPLAGEWFVYIII